MPDSLVPAATVDDVPGLRAIYGAPGERAVRKDIGFLDKHCRHFIALSPFLVIASASAAGPADASPKGDAPGFVHVLDDKTLIVPDRLGNNRIDTLLNIVENPHVGLIFFVPGINETLRVNGRAEVVVDPALLAPMAVNGKLPLTGMLVHVDQAYLHCAKALMRSHLWDASRHVERKSYPSLGKVIADQLGGTDVQQAEASIEEGYRTRLY